MPRIVYVCCVIGILILCFAACQAQDNRTRGTEAPSNIAAGDRAANAPVNLPPPYSEVEREGEGFVSSAKLFLNLVFRICLLAVIVVGVVWALKRYGSNSGLLAALSGMRTSSGRGSMRVIETLPMAQGRAMHLVEIGGKVMIVGSTPQTITLISEITDTEEIEAIKKQSYKASPFLRHLDEDEATYSADSPREAAASLRGVADSLLAKSQDLRRRKRTR